MDCFEVRREFAEFWRGSIEEEQRDKLLEHLSNCAGCDRAFRSFALTAPVLHSDSRPVAKPSDDVAPARNRGVQATRMDGGDSGSDVGDGGDGRRLSGGRGAHSNFG